MLKVTDAKDCSVSYKYDAAGNLVKEIDALGNMKSYSYVVKIVYSFNRNLSTAFDKDYKKIFLQSLPSPQFPVCNVPDEKYPQSCG